MPVPRRGLLSGWGPTSARAVAGLVTARLAVGLPIRQVGWAGRSQPREIRERTRVLPVRIPGPKPESPTGSQELEFIFRTLVELKMQLGELRQRIEGRPSERVEVIEVGSRDRGLGSREIESTLDPLIPNPESPTPVIYKPGMTMSEVERAAIDAALRETHGNRRKAAETLGIGERTLYRKLKEYAID